MRRQVNSASAGRCCARLPEGRRAPANRAPERRRGGRAGGRLVALVGAPNEFARLFRVTVNLNRVSQPPRARSSKLGRETLAVALSKAGARESRTRFAFGAGERRAGGQNPANEMRAECGAERRRWLSPWAALLLSCRSARVRERGRATTACGRGFAIKLQFVSDLFSPRATHTQARASERKCEEV